MEASIKYPMSLYVVHRETLLTAGVCKLIIIIAMIIINGNAQKRCVFVYLSCFNNGHLNGY